MAIVAAAVIPHSPLLLPSIAKEHSSLFSVTQTAVAAICENIYAAQPDLIVVLTPHGEVAEAEVVLHVADYYQGNVTLFGDFTTQGGVIGSPSAAHQLKMTAEREHLSVQMQTHSELDYGTVVPLVTSFQQLATIPWLPILVTHQDAATCLRLGQLLYEHFTSSRTRVAFIASADLTRRKQTAAANEQRPTAEEKTISQAITAVDPSLLASMLPMTTTCGYSPILSLLAALQQVHPAVSITSFEAPMGVGLLTAIFHCNG